MLQNAVLPIVELRQVKTTMDLQHTLNGTIPTYVQYCNLLLAAAAGYDKKAKPQPRQALVHQLQDYLDEYPEGSTFDIDTTPDTLYQVHEASQRTSNPAMIPKEHWLQMLPAG